MTMPNSRILAWGDKDRSVISSLDEEMLHRPRTWLLWPEGPSEQSNMLSTAPPGRIVVLDATWRQARHLYKRLPVLHTMPRLALSAPARFRNRLRKQHRSDGMSTIEAVAAALTMIEGAKVAEPLEILFDEVVRRTTTWRWKRNKTVLSNQN